MITTYHPSVRSVFHVIKRNWRILATDPDVNKLYQQQPLLAYRKGRNLKDSLVHTKLSCEQLTGTFLAIVLNVLLVLMYIKRARSKVQKVHGPYKTTIPVSPVMWYMQLLVRPVTKFMLVKQNVVLETGFANTLDT